MGFLDKTLGKLFGNKSDRDLKELTPYLAKIKAESDRVINLSHDEIREESTKLKQRIQDYVQAETDQVKALKDKIENGGLSVNEKEDIYDQIDKIEGEIDEKIEEVLDEILPTAFAIVKDTARRLTENEEIEVTANQFDRDLAPHFDNVEIDGDKAVYFNSWTAGGTEIVWNMIHYDVQLIGGTVLHKGKIAEMATGEGKTLVATLPVFLNALTGRGVHVVTVNDYLAKRDSEWMGPLYQFHGMSVDCIDKHSPNSDERRKAYASDITFGTNNEFGFDYLTRQHG